MRAASLTISRRDFDAGIFDLDGVLTDTVDGRPRSDGVRSFLASRGINLPEGFAHTG
jgi:beta-phosphoglucomutase-like phosphatase (HAD superfamily)